VEDVESGSDVMNKVYEALQRAGLKDNEIVNTVMDMQNNGILFRELPGTVENTLPKCNRLTIMAVYADGQSTICDIREPVDVTLGIEEEWDSEMTMTPDRIILPAKVHVVLQTTLGKNPAMFTVSPVPEGEEDGITESPGTT
jgi:hypothetical protein